MPRLSRRQILYLLAATVAAKGVALKVRPAAAQPAGVPTGAPLNVLSAGSLMAALQAMLGPAFTAATGVDVVTTSGPSVDLANQLRSGQMSTDIFMSADAQVMPLLLGPANNNRASWFLTLVASRMVLAYSPQSKFKADLDAAAAGTKPWYEVVQQPGFVLKRGDPRTDPGGYRGVFVVHLAEAFYGIPGLADTILHGDNNEDQIIGSAAGLNDGSIDGLLIYEASAQAAGLPAISLPDAINLGDPTMVATYAQATYTNLLGQRFYGSPIAYGVTILANATQPIVAESFLRYVFSADGQAVLQSAGFLPTPILVGGDQSAVPASLRAFIQGTYSV